MIDSRELNLDGHNLCAVTFNPETGGPPIFLLHGITGSIDFWIPQEVALFSRWGPCYALSLPGHYPASFPPSLAPEALTADRIASLLTGAIRQLVGDQPVILVGHSTGGFAALAIAALTPEIARGVISISGFAQGRWTGALGISQRLVRSGRLGRRLFKASFQLARSTRPGLRAGWRIYTAKPGRLYAYPHFDTVFEQTRLSFQRLDLDAMAKYFAVMPDIDISPLLPNITAPTLVLTGDCDPTVPPAQAYLIAGRVPRADLVVFKGGIGHHPFFEDPAGFRQAVGSWLSRQLNGQVL